MSGYAIICDARKGKDLGIEILGMVDRTKTKKQWWTSDNPYIMIRFHKEGAAKQAAARLNQNNPRVVPFNEAMRAILEQARDIDHHQAMCDAEAGWDGHKEAW